MKISGTGRMLTTVWLLLAFSSVVISLPTNGRNKTAQTTPMNGSSHVSSTVEIATMSPSTIDTTLPTTEFDTTEGETTTMAKTKTPTQSQVMITSQKATPPKTSPVAADTTLPTSSSTTPPAPPTTATTVRSTRSTSAAMASSAAAATTVSTATAKSTKMTGLQSPSKGTEAEPKDKTTPTQKAAKTTVPLKVSQGETVESTATKKDTGLIPGIDKDSFTAKVILPIAAGIVLAVFIVLISCSVRSCLEKKNGKSNGRKRLMEHDMSPTDRVMLLADSSEDEF